jgi:hypothetical protein
MQLLIQVTFRERFMAGHYVLSMKTDRENDDVIFFEKGKETRRRMIPNHAVRNNDN